MKIKTTHNNILILSFVADEMIFLIFSQNDTRVCFNVSIIDDNIHEQDEVFFVKITTSDPQVILSPRQTNLTINDNDGKIIIIHGQFPFLINRKNSIA